jgi:hypothetical protein
MYTYDVPGHYGKATAPGIAIALGALIFDFNRFVRFRPHLADLPMLAWCFAPALTSVSLGDSFHEAFYGTTQQIFKWGLPYFLGRLYFTDLESIGDLALGIVVGALGYLPLVYWELKMSPNLHFLVYGYLQHTFSQTQRFGGWRPMVFLQHGLAMGFYMGAASVIAFWLSYARSVRSIRGVPMYLVALFLIITTIACKSSLAILLMFIGCVLLWAASVTRMRIVMTGFILILWIYMLARTWGGWSGQSIVDVTKRVIPDRISSIEVRIRSEDLMWQKAQTHLYFGNGDWGRALVYDRYGRQMSVPDAFWIYTLSASGIFGLLTVYLAMLIGPVQLCSRIPAKYWGQPLAAPAIALAVIVVLHMCDNLFNAMLSPIFMMASGAVAGVSHSNRDLEESLESDISEG